MVNPKSQCSTKWSDLFHLGHYLICRKQQQPYITDGDIEVIYKPVSFKFSRPLIYEEITPETVREKVILIQVTFLSPV